jgi:EmrB/QacA subfamily drug resistance transporter
MKNQTPASLWLVRLRALMNSAKPSKDTDAPATHQATSGVLLGLMAPSMTVGIYIAMFGVALPVIRDDFGIQADLAAWLDIIYSLPFMIFMPLYGRLGDALGKRRVFSIGIVIFLLGTAMAAFAPNLGWLMLGRAVQGFGTAGFVPLSIAIIAQLFPINERGKAMGTWNSSIPLMGMVGPFLGGLLVDHLGWRTIFGPALIVGILAFFAIQKFVPSRSGGVKPDFLRHFDWGGVALLGAAITGFLFYVSSRPITGVAALRDWRLLAITLLLLGGFIYWEGHHANPLVPLPIFARRTFTLASLCAGIRMCAMSGIHFLTPLYLTDVHHLNAATTGVILTVHAGALVLILRLGGQLADRWGSRWPVVVSLSIQAGAMTCLAYLPATAALWLVVLGILVHGLAASTSLAALHRAAMVDVPAEQSGVAAGLYSMIRFAGSVFGTALGGVILQQGLDRLLAPVEAYQLVYLFIAGVALLGAILGVGLKA